MVSLPMVHRAEVLSTSTKRVEMLDAAIDARGPRGKAHGQ
jgi:hypothetical protein